MKPLVYIIVLHWKHVHETEECLSSLNGITYENFRTIVVNNDASELPDQFLHKFPDIFLINNYKNLGYAGGNNKGIQRALDDGADYLLILNNDTIVKSDFLTLLVDHCEAHKRIIVSPVVYYFNLDRIDNCGGFLIPWLGIAAHNKNIKKVKPDYLVGSSLFIKSSYMRDVGLLDDDYFAYFEDTDWMMRARQKGYHLEVVPKSIVWHKHSVSTHEGKGWGSIKAYYLARNTILFGRKNFHGLRKCTWIIAYMLFGCHLHIIYFCRSAKTIKNIYRGIYHGLKNVTSYQDLSGFSKVKSYYENVYSQKGTAAYPFDQNRYQTWLSTVPNNSALNSVSLDYGCGAGFVCSLLQQRGYAVYGTDISEKALDLAKKEVPEGHFFFSDPSGKLDFPDNHFDLLTCFGVLEHLADPEPVVRECYRTLKKEGTAIFIVPNSLCPYFWCGGTGQILERPRTLGAWRELFKNAAFDLKSVTRDPGPTKRDNFSLMKKVKILSLEFINRWLPMGFTYQLVFVLKK